MAGADIPETTAKSTAEVDTINHPSDRQQGDSRAAAPAKQAHETPSTSSNPLVEFGNSLAYTIAEQPLRAGAQVVDAIWSGVGADNMVKKVFGAIHIDQPQHATFGTWNWTAQQFGSALGMLPYMRLPKGLRALEEGGGAQGATLLSASFNEAAHMGRSGFVYGAFLTPTEGDAANGGLLNLVGERLKQGSLTGASFAAMGFANPGTAKLLSETARVIESSGLSPLVSTPIARAFSSPIASGVVSGIPAGFTNAQVAAWESGKKYASLDEVTESIAGMAMIGGVFGGYQSFKGALATRAAQRRDTNFSNLLPDELSFYLAERNEIEDFPWQHEESRILSLGYSRYEQPGGLYDHSSYRSRGRDNPVELKMPWGDETPANLADLPWHQRQTIARIWNKLSEEDRTMPGARLSKHAEVLSDILMSPDRAKELSANPQFVDYYHSNSLVIKNEPISKDDLFKSWLAHPTFRDLGARELVGIGQLTDAQRNLPREESQLLANAAGTMRLSERQAKLLTEHKDFMPWYQQNQAAVLRLTQTHESPGEILSLWGKLPESLRSRNANELNTISKAWDKLTASQRAMPPETVIEISNISKSLYLDKKQTQNIDPEFVQWFHANRPSDTHGHLSESDHFKTILNVWPDLSPEFRSKDLATLRTISLLPKEVRSLTESERVRYETVAKELELRPEQAARLDSSFVDWFERNHDEVIAAKAAHRYSEHPGNIPEVWKELDPETRKLPVDDLVNIAAVWQKFSPSQRLMGASDLAMQAKIAREIFLSPKDIPKLQSAPEFIQFYNANKPTESRIASSWSEESRGLLAAWESLPKSLQTEVLAGSETAIREALDVGHSWDKLSEQQRKLPRTELVRYSRIAKDTYVSADGVHKITPEYADWYESFQAKHADSSFDTDVARKVLYAWDELSAEAKSLPHDDLKTLVDAWEELSEPQRKLPLTDLLPQAEVINDLHLEGDLAGSLIKIPDFVDWFRKQDESERRMSSFESDKRRKLLETWPELSADRTNLSMKQAFEISASWGHLTSKQKALPAVELADHARVVAELNLEPKLVQTLSNHPEFVEWYQKHFQDEQPGGDRGYYRRENASKVLAGWESIPEHARDGTPHALGSLVAVVDKMSPTQLQLPKEDLLAQSETMAELGLESEQIAKLESMPDFAQWYSANRVSKSIANSAFKIWTELSPEQKQITPLSLDSVAHAWDKLESWQRQLPNDELVGLSRMTLELGLTKDILHNLTDLQDITKWYQSRKELIQTNGDWSWPASAKRVIQTWQDLPLPDRESFNNWITEHYKGTENQLHFIDKIVPAWRFLSETDRQLPPGKIYEKARAITDLFSDANGVSPVPLPAVPSAVVENYVKLKPWQQIAAIDAMSSLLSRRLPIDEQFTAAYDQELTKRLSVGRQTIFEQSNDLNRVVRAYHPQIEPVFADLIVHALKNERQPLRFIQNLNPRDYKNALRRMLEAKSDTVDQLAAMDMIQAADNPFVVATKGGQSWENDSALKVLTIFGKQWPRWMDVQQQHERNAHDATVWLSNTPSETSHQLAEWMFRFHDKPPTETGVVAGRWNALTPEQREGHYKDVLSAAMSVKYGKQRDASFAVEAARWGISEENYYKWEDRYLRSLDTPSPFPLDKTWSLNGLSLRFIPRNDPRGLFLGKHTDCCQRPDHDTGNTAAWMGQENPNAGFIVVENKRAEVVAQSLAWEADSGALMLDSIEGKGLGSREDTVARLYEMMADELKDKYHQVNVGDGFHAGRKAVDLERWATVDKDNLIPKPFDYGGYSDTASQRIITHNPNLKPRERPPMQAWLRGADERDLPAAREIMRRVYPEGWQFVPHGDWNRVLEVRGQGIKGGYVLDTQSRSINDIFVDPEYRRLSRTVLFDMLHKMKSLGPEPWHAQMRDSTSFKLLEQAVKARWIMIHDQRTIPGAMAGEDMHAVTFSLAPRSSPQQANPAQQPNTMFPGVRRRGFPNGVREWI